MAHLLQRIQRKLSIVAKGMHLFSLMQQPVAAGTSIGRRAVAAGTSLRWQQLGLATASADSSVQRVHRSLGEDRQRMLELGSPCSRKYGYSQMTSEWWQRDIKKNHSTISICCQQQQHHCRVSETTQVTEMSSRPGYSLGYFCKGKIRCSTLEARNNILELISKRFANKYDTSEMTPEWWHTNVTGSLSKLDMTCRDCGYRGRTTRINSLQQGQRVGCLCTGSVRWSTPEGHQRLLGLIEQRCGAQYDTAAMTWAWWQDHVQGSFSKLHVICRDCGHSSKGTNINQIQQGSSFSCFCNGKVSWSTVEGYHRMMSLIAHQFGVKYNASRMTFQWWQDNIQNAFSKLDVTCRDCGHRTRTTAIQSVRRGKRFACFCTRAVRWSTPEGHQRFLELIVKRYGDTCDASRMTLGWWKANVHDRRSKLDITCKTCNHHNTTSTIANLSQGHSFACLCNGGVRWSTPEGHARMLKIISERFGDKYDASVMSWEWWQDHIKGCESKLKVSCKDCRISSTTTCVRSVQQGQGFACGCRHKTEAKVLEWLQGAYGMSTVSWQVPGCLNPLTGRTLPFDFGLFDSQVLIELDGDIGHFGEGWPGSADGDGGVPERDLFKEEWAVETGRVVIRLLQQDVLKDSVDWRNLLQDAVAASVADRRPRVITQDSPKYDAGRYYELRFGNPSTKPQAGPHPSQIPSSRAPRPL
ncbi:unnamed protein product [Polarella glacialis]|uniref:Uncharacterized protein n=1 Tax=Polarella glacialis TaxID=89957 RepID=A0A813E7K4_POLGL|nr:unnamed protein product [Polarella glacialis]